MAVERRVPMVLVIAWSCSVGLAAPARGQASTAEALGAVTFPVSCSAAAQVAFERGVVLLHHMTYPGAQRSFLAAAAADSSCAMAQWGVAMTLFQPLWPTRPEPAELERGWGLVETALALQPPTRREQLFVATAEAFYRDPASEDYWLRIRRWADATARLHEELPDDPEAAAFRALALLATASAAGPDPARSERISTLLLELYDRNPEHPGAMHYLVHANDAPGRERVSLDVTTRYEAVAPRNAHALHMPTHIYTRLGDWPSVVRGNVLAAAAALEQPAGPEGEFVWDEYPHALEYLVYALLQQGQDSLAYAQVVLARTTPLLEPTFKTAFHLVSIPARYALERHDWAEARALAIGEAAVPVRGRFAWPEAIGWFARGMGAAHTGDELVAQEAAGWLSHLEAEAQDAGEELFARSIRVLSLELGARLAHAAGSTDESVALMREAAALERATPKHPVTPGPILPAEELLGDLLMEHDAPVEALAAYRRALAAHPGRFNSILGAARAAHAAGDPALARTFYEELLRVAGSGTRLEPLDEGRRYLNPAP